MVFMLERLSPDLLVRQSCEDPTRWLELHFVASLRQLWRGPSSWDGRWEVATDDGKIKRTGVRELSDDRRSGNLCLHIGF